MCGRKSYFIGKLLTPNIDTQLQVNNSNTPSSLPPGKSHLYRLHKSLIGPENQSVALWQREHFLAPVGSRTIVLRLLSSLVTNYNSK